MTCTTRGTSYLELTTTRIYRLLRPLRSHCVKFSECYAKFQARGSSPDWLPLEILLPPDRIGSRIFFDKDQGAKLELSRTIYAVRDCFKHIVLNTKTGACATTQPRVLNLTDICAIIVGQNVEANNEKSESIYDAMPHAYKRVTLLNHAIDIILDTAPHHITLLSAVLDVCLSHSLLHEARTTLHALLCLAIRPSSSYHSAPPVTHPTHSSFLVDLCERWKSAGQLESSFFHVFLEVLHESWGPSLLGCKAVNKLARLMFRTDPPSFFQWLLCMLQREVQHLGSPRDHHAPFLDLANARIDRPRSDWLHKWINFTLEGLSSQDSALWSLELFTYLGYLVSLLLRSLPILEDPPLSALHGTSICLATFWLTEFSVVAPSPLVTEVLECVQSFDPRPTSYAPLIALIQKRENVASSLDLDEFHEYLDRFARTLQSHGFLSLEASLWGCVLRVIEDPEDIPAFARFVDPDILKDYQQQIMNLRDEAEERCYG
ncbi:hypothetical protein BDN72DRAFT_757911, partial [Pluteus cervinus]